MNSLKLLFLRILFGKFSFTYQHNYHLTKVTGKSRKKHLQGCSRINGYGHLFPAFEFTREITHLSTRENIAFQNIEPYEKFRKFVRKNRHYVSYDIEKYDSVYCKRIAYKEKMFNNRAKFIYHFINDLFFFGEIFFSDARTVDIDGMRKTLFEKYGISDVKTKEKFRINSPEAFVFFDYNGINLSIKYVFTEDKTINDIVANQIMKPNNPSYQTVAEKPLEEIL